MHFLAVSADHGPHILVSLLLMLAAAKLFAEIFQRLRQPAVVGEILAGIVIGPSILHWVAPSEITNVFADMGVVFLLFHVGLQTPVSSIFRVGQMAAVVAICGVILPLVAGWALLRAWGHSNTEALFAGTALVATSVGITARVLSALGALDTKPSRIILAAAVIDDVLGLLVLAVVSSVAAGTIHYTEIATTTALAFAFVGFITVFGPRFFGRITPWIEQIHLEHGFFIMALITCLLLSAAAGWIGIASIVGAFLAGMALAQTAEDKPAFQNQITGVTEFLTPFFLVSIGMKLNLAVLAQTSTLLLAVVLTVVAVLTKLVGCGLPAWKLGPRAAAQIGMGMVPRGEVGIVVAQIGLGLGVVDDSLFGIVVVMAIATTLIAPPFLGLLLRRRE